MRRRAAALKKKEEATPIKRALRLKWGGRERLSTPSTTALSADRRSSRKARTKMRGRSTNAKLCSNMRAP